MSTKTAKDQVAAINTRFARVYWAEDLNFAREQPSSKREQLVRLLRGGWNHMLGVIPAQEIKGISDRMGRDFVKECLATRQAQWDTFKADKSPDGTIKRAVFEDLFVEGGKLIEPQWVANACFQRGAVFFDAMVLRRQAPDTDEQTGNSLPGAHEVRDFVPVLPRDYKNEGERLEEQVSENEQKTQGSEPLSDRDRLRTSRKFFQMGYNQTYLRRLYTDTTGQKLFAICKLDHMWPNLHIFERLLKDKDAEDRIPYGPLSVNDLNSWVRRSKKETCKPGETLLTESDMAGILADVNKARTVREPIMKREHIEGLATQSPVCIIADACKSVLSNNSDLIQKYIPLQVGINALVEIAAMGGYQEVENYLVSKHKALLEAKKATAK